MASYHHQLEQRGLALARAIVEKLDLDPGPGLSRAQQNCSRWLTQRPNEYLQQWSVILQQDWSQIRLLLLSESPEATQLRQNSPFAGILTPQERWKVYRHDPS